MEKSTNIFKMSLCFLITKNVLFWTITLEYHKNSGVSYHSNRRGAGYHGVNGYRCGYVYRGDNVHRSYHG